MDTINTGNADAAVNANDAADALNIGNAADAGNAAAATADVAADNAPEIAVLCGAVSPEREVSLRSGAAAARALEEVFPGRVSLLQLDANALPAALDPARHVVFPVIHGDYGEDGGIQADLEARGFAYAGCDAAASRVCINKAAAKEKFRAAGAPVAPGFAFNADVHDNNAARAADNAVTVATAANARVAANAKPTAAALIAALGTSDIVLKPADKGSSVGLKFVRSEAALASALAEISCGNWLAEARVDGREMTIGILDGAALGIVEIRPVSGRYDYQTKYTPGGAEYLFPASVSLAVEAEVSRAAERIFAACGCRDFARADFILKPDDTFVFLEINTMPGLTATSLFPKSAACSRSSLGNGDVNGNGLDFPALCRRMISPALRRFAGPDAQQLPQDDTTQPPF